MARPVCEAGHAVASEGQRRATAPADPGRSARHQETDWGAVGPAASSQRARPARAGSRTNRSKSRSSPPACRSRARTAYSSHTRFRCGHGRCPGAPASTAPPNRSPPLSRPPRRGPPVPAQVGFPRAPRHALRPCAGILRARSAEPARETPRSEEHTSELQSRVDLVCRPLLEKKKKEEKTKTAAKKTNKKKKKTK